MSYVFKNYVKNNDGTYGPDQKGNYYKGLYYHSKNANKFNDKTRWIIEEDHEYAVFCIADENGWNCTKSNCLFAIIDNCKIILGDSYERIAKFWIPQNANIFHGFPIKHVFISEQLLDYWENSGVITKGVRRKIAQCKI
jgi:hypothetical protein